ncbi:hypothetical protein LINGRAHAP2_LOCUS19225 [Linum grandiflorum]
MASPSDKRDWKWLPIEILTLIVPYLVSSQDYIRFSAVCKHWHSVAKAEKQNHMATRKQIPFLLIPTNDQWSLYSVAQGRLLDSKLRVQAPSRKDICGSSHGWLIFDGYDDDITLFNPFTQAQISLPRITGEERPCFVERATLSADPSLHPNDYIVAACFIFDMSRYVLALIRPGRGDVKWMTLAQFDWWADIDYVKRCDIMFDRSGKSVYAAIGYNGVFVRADVESGVSETVRVQTSSFTPVRYLGQTSSGGDLLMFSGVYDDKVKVWKLQGSSFVEVKDLIGDTAAFIGRHSSTMFVGRGFQGVEANCAYFYRQFPCNIIAKFNLIEAYTESN